MTKSQAGRKGGKALVAKYGREHMRTIGKKGAQATHSKYKLVPVLMVDFALVERSTGKPVALLSGNPVSRLGENARF